MASHHWHPSACNQLFKKMENREKDLKNVRLKNKEKFSTSSHRGVNRTRLCFGPRLPIRGMRSRGEQGTCTARQFPEFAVTTCVPFWTCPVPKSAPQHAGLQGWPLAGIWEPVFRERSHHSLTDEGHSVPRPFVPTMWLMLNTCFPSGFYYVPGGVPTWPARKEIVGAGPYDLPGRQHLIRVLTTWCCGITSALRDPTGRRLWKLTPGFPWTSPRVPSPSADFAVVNHSHKDDYMPILVVILGNHWTWGGLGDPQHSSILS